MKKYRVYINQVNQTFIDVKASSEEVAERKAEREWKRGYGPSVMSVAELKDGDI